MAEIYPTNVEFQDFPSVGGTTAPLRRQRMIITVTAANAADTVRLSDFTDITEFESIGLPIVSGSTPPGGTSSIDISGTVITMNYAGVQTIDLVVRYT